MPNVNAAQRPNLDRFALFPANALADLVPPDVAILGARVFPFPPLSPAALKSWSLAVSKNRWIGLSGDDARP